MQIKVNDIFVEIHKKPIKNVHLYVKPPEGCVSISAPLNMNDNAIETLIRTKVGWIKNQQKKFKNQLRQTKREYVSGETLYLWGKQYYLQVNHANTKRAITLDGNKAVFLIKENTTTKQRDSFVKEWYRALLKNEIERLLPKWEKITGLHCDSWQTKYMTTRWGTCNTQKKKIYLNLQLAKKPIDCLEYVILHELVHLKNRNHDKAFVSAMDENMPFWREIRKRLNDQILDYYEPMSE